MPSPTPPQVQLEVTYNAAADHYDQPPLSFWDRFGRRTADRLPLACGMRVLDVCCGMGASALPAAERVGPTGQVIAVDLAQNLLQKGAYRAAQRGLTNIEFRRGDLERLPADSIFWQAVRREDAELVASIKPWSKIVEPEPLRAVLIECGVPDPEVVSEAGTHPITAPEDWGLSF
jgi:SAM-dependent methyltransferase